MNTENLKRDIETATSTEDRRRWVAWHGDEGILFSFSDLALQSGEVEVSPYGHFSASAIESAEQGLVDLPPLTTQDQSYWQVNGAIVRVRGY